MNDLHQKYAPVLRFNKDEQFFPMRVEDMLAYSSLYTKDEPHPVLKSGEVTPERLARYGRSGETFLRSVSEGPLTGEDVINDWGRETVEMVLHGAAKNESLSERLARKAYSWFSPRTRSATHLFWWNDLIASVLNGQLTTAGDNELPRLILPSETQQNAAERYRASYRRRPAYTYYYRLTPDGDYWCLQYWFFYSFNDWGRRFGGMNDHEGDWEGMMLFFRQDANGRPQEPPAYVTFADHESRQTKPWDDPDVARSGTHPIAFVAAGSHATYPEASTHPLMALYNLFDFATGDGQAIDHDDWRHAINLDDVPWLGQYPGTWGTRFWLPLAKAQQTLRRILALTPLNALLRLNLPREIELPGVSAPRGPVNPHRPQYATPVAWAGVP